MIDLRQADSGTRFEADIAIIGGGAAGIAMAHRLISSGLQVIIVESGGETLEPATQALYAGTASGVPYFPLDQSRYRLFGGSTYRWGSRSAPFQHVDMEPRAWLGLDGWPILRDSLQPWYDGVPALMDLHTPFDHSHVPWNRFRVHPPAIDTSQLDFTGFQFGKNLLFGEIFRKDLRAASNVLTLLHSNVTKSATSERADHVTALQVRTLEGKTAEVHARKYVLAAGGIENARLLLLSDDRNPAGLCNDHDQVGRHFMEHPTASVGTIASDAPQATHDIFSPGLLAGRLVEVCLQPSVTLMRHERILNANAATRLNLGQDATEALRQIVWNMRSRKVPMSLGWYRNNAWLRERVGTILRNPFAIPGNLIRHAMGRPKRFAIDSVRLEVRIEQLPNPDSRVTLGAGRDAFGQRRAHLDWRLTETDWRTFRVMADRVGAELARLGLGRLSRAPWLDGPATAGPESAGLNRVWPDDLVGGHHHMGTTRMSADPAKGVVDRNLKSHAKDNLWDLGSSVYPTSSQVNPTMTVLALALRRAEHLKEL